MKDPVGQNETAVFCLSAFAHDSTTGPTFADSFNFLPQNPVSNMNVQYTLDAKFHDKVKVKKRPWP